MPTETVTGLKTALLRESFAAIEKLAEKPEERPHKELLAAIRALPLLIRRHGLAATLAIYWNEGAAKEGEKKRTRGVVQRAVATSFVAVLAKECPAGLSSAAAARAHIDTLRSEDLAAYLLHSRVALVLADAWYELAEPLLPGAKTGTDAAATAGAEQKEVEATHA